MFETSERIEINLLEEKAAMDFLKCEEKPLEKIKIAETSLPSQVLMLWIQTLHVLSVAKQGI